MSDTETTSAPRRSHRERKQAKPFVSGTFPSRSCWLWPSFSLLLGSPQKRKRDNIDTDAEFQDDDSDHISNDGDEEDYSTPKLKAKSSITRKRSTKASPSKRVRTAKGQATKGTSSQRRRSKKTAVNSDVSTIVKPAKDTKIAQDNVLFSECEGYSQPHVLIY